MSRIALGTYSIHGPLEGVVWEALKRGCRLFDTAPNYRHGQAQKELTIVLKQGVPTESSNPSENIQIFSKVGFFSPQRGDNFYKQGLISAQDAETGHSLNPAYVRYQVLKNLEELERPFLDVLFLHNPEKRFTLEPQEKAWQQIQEAFEVLEEFCAQGLLRGYGVATWSGFEAHQAPHNFTLVELLETAKKASTNHHFKAVQLPLSLVKLDAVVAYFEQKGPLYEAQQEGVEVFGSSPLHGGQLPPLLGAGLLERIDPSHTPAQACLLFAKSIPGVSAVFTSPSSLMQLEQSLDVSKRDSLSEETVCGLLQLLQQKTRMAS